MNTDPVCNMTVSPQESRYQVEYKGSTYYFCTEGYMKAFNTNPEQYLNRVSGMTSGHNHNNMSGCCGMGMGSGWMRYLYIGIMLLYLVSIFLR